MITCFLRYEVDPDKLKDFEDYGRMWIRLVNKLGGTHHGYLMPSEGAGDIALASFSFPSMAAYEQYRIAMAGDDECKAAWEFAQRTKCIRRYERSFFRPVFE
ncbi:MAG: NIPSNAP family protein [Ferrovibrio sp.]